VTDAPLAIALPPAARILVGDGVGGGRRAAVAVERAAEVVDDDRCAPRRQRQRVQPAEAAACAGHDRHSSVESNRHAPSIPSLLI
jgi:hypothetical protein